MVVLALAVSGLFGCPDAPPESICRAGFTLAPDGHCYPPPPDPRDPVITDVLNSLPDCVPREPSGEIDLTSGCADDACVGQDFDTIDVVLRGKGRADCFAIPDSDDVECVWGDVIGAKFTVDAVLSPDPADGAPAQWIRLLRRYEGASLNGLGTRITPRCFVEVLDQPDLVVFTDVEGTLRIRQMTWDRFGVIVLDVADGRGNNQPDGTIDELILLGAP